MIFLGIFITSNRYEPGQDLAVWAVNDTLSALKGQVHVSVYNFSGEQLFTHAFEAAVGANNAIQLGRLPEAAVLNGALHEKVVVRVYTTDWAAPDNLLSIICAIRKTFNSLPLHSA